MKSYTKTAVVLHWLNALGLIVAFAMGFVLVNLPSGTPNKPLYFSWHKWLGITIFFLVLVRIFWRMFHRPPAYASTHPAWQIQAAKAVHGLLYEYGIW